MAGTFSDFVENAVVDQVCGVAAYTFVTQAYLTLFTVNPNFETGAGGTEAAGGGFVRKAINFDASSGGGTQSDGAIVWTVGTDIAAGTYTGWAVYDAAAAGNMLFGDALTPSKVLTSSGDTLTFADTAIQVSLT